MELIITLLEKPLIPNLDFPLDFQILNLKKLISICSRTWHFLYEITLSRNSFFDIATLNL